MKDILSRFTVTSPSSIESYLFGSEGGRAELLQRIIVGLSGTEVSSYSSSSLEPQPLEGHPKRLLTLEEITQLQNHALSVDNILQNTIEDLRLRVSSATPNHQGLGQMYHKLGHYLLKRYWRFSEISDLNESISYQQESLQLVSSEGYVYLEILLDLCSAIYHRFQILRRDEDRQELLVYLHRQSFFDIQTYLIDQLTEQHKSELSNGPYRVTPHVSGSSLLDLDLVLEGGSSVFSTPMDTEGTSAFSTPDFLPDLHDFGVTSHPMSFEPGAPETHIWESDGQRNSTAPAPAYLTGGLRRPGGGQYLLDSSLASSVRRWNTSLHDRRRSSWTRTPSQPSAIGDTTSEGSSSSPWSAPARSLSSPSSVVLTSGKTSTTSSPSLWHGSTDVSSSLPSPSRRSSIGSPSFMSPNTLGLGLSDLFTSPPHASRLLPYEHPYASYEEISNFFSSPMGLDLPIFPDADDVPFFSSPTLSSPEPCTSPMVENANFEDDDDRTSSLEVLIPKRSSQWSQPSPATIPLSHSALGSSIGNSNRNPTSTLFRKPLRLSQSRLKNVHPTQASVAPERPTLHPSVSHTRVSSTFQATDSQ